MTTGLVASQVPVVDGRVAPGTTWCGELELSNPAIDTRPLTSGGLGFARARVLVRLHGEPLGYVDLPTGPGGVLDPVDVLRLTDRDLGPAVARHLAADGIATATGTTAAGPLPPRGPSCTLSARDTTTVTVVVCTRDRPAGLVTCLAGLRGLTHPHLDVVIVDNAPSDDATRRAFDATVGADPRFTYVREDTPGLSHARNAGLAEATGAVIAYTDDDVRVDGSWVTGLLRGFRAGPDIGCVTGLAATETIETPAERYFDARLTWADHCRPRRYDLSRHREPGPLYPYSAGIFGTGANVAFRTTVLRDLGGFDPALGAGTPTTGGEDLDMFVRVLRAGYAIYYDPAAVVWHRHRADVAALRRQMFGYGAGMTAYLARRIADPATRSDVLTRIPRGLWAMRTIGRTTRSTVETGPADASPAQDGPAQDSSALRRRLLAWEYAGFASGPYLYVKSRRQESHRVTETRR